MKLNELVCPTCGLKCLTDAAWTTCASCNAMFYANQSRSVDNPAPLLSGIKIVVNPDVTGPVISPQPVKQPIDIMPNPIWIAPFGPPESPYGPSVTCEISVGGVLIVEQDQFQIWT